MTASYIFPIYFLVAVKNELFIFQSGFSSFYTCNSLRRVLHDAADVQLCTKCKKNTKIGKGITITKAPIFSPEVD